MLLLTLTIVRGQTSVYHPFPDSNAVWTVYCQGYPGLCQCSCTLCIYNETDQDSLGGDTVIGSYAYHKLYNQYARLDYCDSPPSCSPGYYPSTTTNYNYQYYGAIRQNISLKKVYIYYRQSSTEQLLYDFDLHVGNTLQATMITPANTNYVHKIDSFLVSGNYRKRFWIWYKAGTPPTSADSGYAALIEGVGSTQGLLTSLGPPFEVTCGLSCEKVNSNTIFPNNTTTCSSLHITGIDKKEIKLSFKVFPIPFYSSATLQANKNLNNATLTIYNSFGQQVKQIKNIYSEAIVLQRDNLPSGLYFLQLTQDDKTIVSDKLVIVDN